MWGLDYGKGTFMQTTLLLLVVGLFAELCSWIANVSSPIEVTSSVQGSLGALFGCWSVRRAWQLDCKRFITNRGEIVSAGLSG
ncbi:hypothetical protein T265_12084 [Opisthorchis viverrini]|uniref:Uncharacterized protein n=1 Tax=Opisthorchis viverrini TaxID=6198 RepID=A0A074Z0F0_OPIVI|nr:hypothetical protein T265_12084 [Opisthorchis viverrini]KER18952.1 hypothetical protein T265_12084 [Opisthorchis viverrini]